METKMKTNKKDQKTQEKKVNTFTPFVKQPIVEKTSDQKPETTDVKKEKKKFSFSKILSSFSNDNMFNNNEA